MKMKQMNRIISLIFALIFASMSVVGVYAEEMLATVPETLDATSMNETELMPMMASNCRYNHYEVTSSWPNGNVQTVTYWVVDAQGNRIGTDTWTASYPATGDGAMGAYGTPGGFAGCQCPNCR